jgi:hypothetical protein
LKLGRGFASKSYIGAEGGQEGVKLEQQVLIGDKRVELLSTYPLEEELYS